MNNPKRVGSRKKSLSAIDKWLLDYRHYVKSKKCCTYHLDEKAKEALQIIFLSCIPAQEVGYNRKSFNTCREEIILNIVSKFK